jgi:hypothetical protein
MAQTFKWYLNSSLTTELTTLSQAFGSDGSDGAIDKLVYLGSTTSLKKILAASDPGVDAIPISIADDDGSGTGQAATSVKLALTQGDLDTAVGGAAIDGPAQILSGVAQALPVWIRRDPSNLTVGTYDDLTITFGPVVERAA